MKDKISDSDKDEIKQLIEKLKKAVSERNVGDVEKHESELKEKWTPIIQKVYQSGQPNANSSNLFDFFTKQTNASDKKSFRSMAMDIYKRYGDRRYTPKVRIRNLW